MTIPHFTQGIPPDGSSLGNTKANIRNNLDGTYQTLSVDHYNQNSANVGKHKFIRFPIQATPNPSTTGANELFLFNGTSVIDGPNNLFFNAPGTTVGSTQSVQMTRNVIPIGNTNGFTWLPGAILFQWGFVTPINNSGTISFNTSFTSACFNVQLTLSGLGVFNTPPGVTAKSTTTFSYRYDGNAPGTFSFYWTAIGK